ncbi:MAG: DUF1552 domain-containing protein [Nannocystales bacterium]
MKRRRFLTGVGGLTLALPALRGMLGPAPAHAGGSTAAPKRVIFVAYENGTYVPAFVPTQQGAGFEFGEICQAMEPLRDRTLVVSRCPHTVLEEAGGLYVGGHPGKKEALFTGTLMQHAFGGDGTNHVENLIAGASPQDHSRTPNGPSVEQVIGAQLRGELHPRDAVNLGIKGAGSEEITESRFFYEQAATPISVLAHPGLAFATLFDGINPDGTIDEAYLELQRRKKSVLDAVRDSFVDLRQDLNAADRAVLDDHAEKVRDVELKLPPLACSIPDEPDAGAFAEMSMAELAPLQNQLMANSMACNLAPVGRIEYVHGYAPSFGVPEVDAAIASNGGWHHPIVHANGVERDDPARIRGYQFYVDMFADLCSRLDEVVEGPDGQTVLDNSIVVLGTDLSSYRHTAEELCFLVAGGGVGRRGYHYDASGTNVNAFLKTLIEMAGISEDALPEEFGLPGFPAGAIEELLS